MNYSQDDIKFFIGLFPSLSVQNDTVHLIPSFGNVGIIETHEGLVMFDMAIKQFGTRNYKKVRAITDKPIKYLIFSHGHLDHCFGFEPFIAEINEKGWSMPEVIAHQNSLKRFKKYQMLADYHEWINSQQFASIIGKQEDIIDPYNLLEPTLILDGKNPYKFQLGDIEFELNHDIGETDDSIWLWVPEKELICTGDLIVSSFPNVGNPYKVQRYPKEWALAMEHMLEKDAKFIIPGHGKLIEGKKKVKEVLEITAEAMHFVHDEVVRRMNEGKWFEQIFHEMLEIYPTKFKNHEYLQPLYGDYRFAIHAVYRLYHGWYNTGNPTDLFPSNSNEIAKELLKLNSPESYINHARELFNDNKYQLALHILDIIIIGKDSINSNLFLDALELKFKILKMKAKEEPSFIVRNILNNEVKQLRSKIKRLKH